MNLPDLVRYLDEYLAVRSIPDSPDALNGLQVASTGSVTRLAAAVDCCEATIKLSVAARADFLLVHHGILWGGPRPVVGPQHRRIAALLDGNIAVYSAHVPLDRHPEVGNNVVLSRQLGLSIKGEFGVHYGAPIGVWGTLSASRVALVAKLADLLATTPKLLPFGPETTHRVGIVTGAGGSLIGQAAAAGLDTLITGEGNHHTFFDAEELGLNVIYAGHYATETGGVKALAEHLATKFGLPWVFLDHPTGL